MRSPPLHVTALLMFVAFTAAGVPDADYARSRAEGDERICLAWEVRELTYHVNVRGSAQVPGDAEFEAIDEAFDSWSAVAASCSDFQLLRGPRVTDTAIGKAPASRGRSIVLFRERHCRDAAPSGDVCHQDGGCRNKYDCWDGDDRTLALTTTTYSPATGVIVDADIEFNASPHRFGRPGHRFTVADGPPCAGDAEPSSSTSCVAVDVQNTATHEIGHALGLDHVASAASTMSESAESGETLKRTIDSGTRRGFCEVYPRARPVGPCLSELARSITAESVGTGAGAVGCAAAPRAGYQP